MSAPAPTPTPAPLFAAVVVSIVGLALLCGLPAGLYIWTIQTLVGACP